ncbi:IS1595 family transposase [Erythrobacter rubeus]|uniref:IS1595 family transposase n=1 Tax=Erythrobacter rubeus TaxID=2760803 RepID=A0ABR8KRG2_9SPHN|nr:IS1595 family transposase [Erythrobacter rubeus]MBD2840776.1 IS1595 family transposase [Erythrobacter rubeus]
MTASEDKSQHFLTSARARTLDLKRIARMSEEEAVDAFVLLRYPETDGEPYCPECGCQVTYKINRTIKNRKTGEVTGKSRKYTCAECTHQFSPTSGTIFHGRKLEHRDILFGIALWVNGAKGEAALHLCRDMNVNPKTAFILEKKLREVMGTLQHAAKLSGEVEGDATYVGGYVKPANLKKNRRDRRKLANQSGKRQAITVLRERGGKSRAFVQTEKQTAAVMRDLVEDGTVLIFDESKAFDGLEALFDVKRVNHDGNDTKNYGEAAYSRDGVHTNLAESSHSRLKRSQMGVHHRISGDHLQGYADEMTWREDHRRKSNGEQFLTLVTAGLHHPPSMQWKGYWQRRKEAA